MRKESGGGIVEVMALFAVDDAIVQTSLRQSATPGAWLRRLAGAGTVAASAGAGRRT
jgi:hypothetical protein